MTESPRARPAGAWRVRREWSGARARPREDARQDPPALAVQLPIHHPGELNVVIGGERAEKNHRDPDRRCGDADPLFLPESGDADREAWPAIRFRPGRPMQTATAI